MLEETPDPSRSIVNELARERNREAADRTLLAWIRTSLAMISLGFAIERLVYVVGALDGRMPAVTPWRSRSFGAALIALGIAATLAGMWEHRQVLAAIRSIDYRYAERPAIARWMGISVIGVGIAALVMILTA